MSFIPYTPGTFYFTLDTSKYIDFYTTNDDTFFTMQLIIRYYDFYNILEKTIDDLYYKIPLFNKKATLNIGEIIHRNLSNITALDDQSLQYKTPLVDIILHEFSIDDETTSISSLEAYNIQFIAGPKPALLKSNKAILSLNSNNSRVTPNGIHLVNFLLPSGTHIIEVFKNNIIVDAETITATAIDNIYSKKLNMQTLQTVPGDVIKVSLKDTILSKEIEVTDYQQYSNMILFVDEFKLLSSLECTGSKVRSIDYSQTTHKYKRNSREILEIIDTKKDEGLILNTGWVLETDDLTIDSLLSGKKAWHFKSNTIAAELAPVAKKLTAENSDDETYQYDLEFKINSSYYAQNYTL